MVVHKLVERYAEFDATGFAVGQAVSGGFPGTGSIFAAGFIGGNANTSGALPPTSKFPYSGGYLGWNAAMVGDVDIYSPYSSASTTADAYDFFVNYGSAFTKVFAIDRSGSITANGADFLKGNIQIGVPSAASTIFSFATAPSGRCTTGDMEMNRAGTPNALYVCQAGAWGWQVALTSGASLAGRACSVS
jgi:hypothetical protein